MKVILHDFSGHPFQAELSRKLAARGHEVEHLSADQYVSGKGHLELQPGDSPTLTFTGVDHRPAVPEVRTAGASAVRARRTRARGSGGSARSGPTP